MSDNIKISSIKKCMGCDEEKPNKLFRRFQTTCIECEKNGVEFKKVCKNCNESKLNTLFETDEICKECKKDKNINKHQKCVGCNETKTKNLFRRSQIICFECEKNPEIEYNKICGGCNEIKNNKMFRINRKKCIDCERSHGRNYRRTTTKASEWVENNQERMIELRHDNYEKNKEEIREKEKERLQNDPHFRMIKSYRNGVCKFIHGEHNSNKKLNINRIQYISWLEFCFVTSKNEDQPENEMTIDNYTKIWQIDHVLALDITRTKKIDKIEFENGINFDCLFNWFNTMPVLLAQNMKKNKYLDKEQLAKHIITLEKFIKKYKISLKINLCNNYYMYKKIVQTILDE
jgi:hypothetical protein